MNPTRNDLPAETRQTLAKLLNERLADLIDLSLQAKQAHWNVKGSSFIALHELFDQVAGFLPAVIDEVGERIVALGGTAEGTIGVVASRTSLPEYPTDITSGCDHVDRLATALAAAGQRVRADIGRATDCGDDGTADLLTSLSRELDKYLWFVEAHLQNQ